MSERIYTHRDKDGILWRFEGGRPISELADQVMEEFGFNETTINKHYGDIRRALSGNPGETREQM